MSIKILLSFGIAIFTTLTIYYIQLEQNNQDKTFQLWKKAHGKVYNSEEVNFRKHIYLKNFALIQNHNKNLNKPYQLQMNQFGDLTQDQFKQIYLGIKNYQKPNFNQILQDKVYYEVDIDWRAEGKVTRVKNQGMCASCWAFCVIGSIESAYLIKGQNQQFSEQQLVDCSNTYGNLGCHGGQLQYTYKYIKDKGLNTEASYPYIAKDQNCKKTHGPYKISNYFTGITCSGLYNALKKGPVAVTVQALFWAFYKDGIFDQCGNQVNHGVLAVGATSQYWLIKNSWGAQWGNNGYIKLKRGNTCSVCQSPYIPEL